MSKITLNDVGNLIDATTAATTINDNSAAIVAAIDNTLSRDGTSPNQMESDFDMNSNDILNVNEIDASHVKINGVEIVVSDLSSLPQIEDGYIFSNISGHSDVPKGNSLDSILDDKFGSSQGSLLYRGASGWSNLLPSDSGKFLKTNGSSSNPSWEAITGGGDVLASNNLSEYTGTQETARENIGAISITQSDVFKGFLYKNNLDNGGLLDIYSGICHDSTGEYLIDLSSPISKAVGFSFTEGQGNGSLDIGTFVTGFYFIHVIYNPTSNKTDILTSFSPFAPYMPSGYTKRRLIGSFYATASGIPQFTAYPDGFTMMWTQLQSVNHETNGPGSYLRTLQVPKGVKCETQIIITAGGTNPVTWPGGYLILKDAELGFISDDPYLAYWKYDKDQTLVITATITTNTAGAIVTADTNTDPPVISIGVNGWRFDKGIYR